MKRLLFALALLFAPTFAAAQEPGIVPFEIAVAGLSAEDVTTRSAAARELAFQGRPEATAAILAALAKPETDPWVRKDFYAALGQLGGEGVLEALLSCVETESREELVGECAAALGNLADPAAIPALLRLTQRKTPAGLVRLRAIDALGSFVGPEAERALIAFLADPEPELRGHAIRALGLNGSDVAAARLLRHLDAAGLDERERALVVQALARMAGRMDLRAAVPSLAPLLTEASSTELFVSATRALSAIGDASAVAAMAAALHSLPMDYKEALARALGGTKSPLAVPSLVAELSLGADAYLARAGAATLLLDRSWGDQLGLLTALCQALAVTDPQGLAPLAAKLAPVPPSPADRQTLLARMTAGLRLAAIDLLAADRGSIVALESLTALSASEPVGRLRAAAVVALGRLGRSEAVGTLVALLGDPDRLLRWAAAMALGELGDPAALPALEAAADDPDALVRRAAAEAALRIAQ